MFAFVKKVLAKVVKVLGMVIGIAIAVALAPALFSLFGTGALAGIAVTAAGWVADKLVVTVLPTLGMLVQTMGLVTAAALLLVSVMLLGLAGIVLDLVEGIARPVIDGYRCVRPARRPAAA